MSISIRNLCHGVICLILLLLVGQPLLLHAQGDEQQVVRVGWIESTFTHKDKFGRRSGYAYDYLRHIAAYTNWQYEYVEDTWENLITQLKAGEIDILSDVSYSQERSKDMLFSEREMGAEEYYIICSTENEELATKGPTALEGKSIGVIKGGIVHDYLQEWIRNRKINCKILPYDLPKEEFMGLLRTGQVDALASISSFTEGTSVSYIPLARMSASPIYFAISKEHPEIKRSLDWAMSRILTSNNYFNLSLHEKYFSHNSTYKFLRPAEKRWLQEKRSIRIGFRDNYMPYCAQDAETGELKGLLKDFIVKASENLGGEGLKFEAVPYPTINDALEAAKRGEVDVAFPSGMSLFDSEQEQLTLTDPLVVSSEMAVLRNNDNYHTDGHVRIAINSSNPNYLSLLRDQYLDWEVVGFPSTKECLKGVADNKADLLLISNYRLGVLSNDLERLKLKAVATGLKIELCFATAMGNSRAYSIMNRVIHLIPHSDIYTSLSLNSRIDREYSFMDYAKENYAALLVGMMVVMGIIIYLLIRSLKFQRSAEAASLAKTQFLFNMSHDIRTPMNAIIGYTNLMQENIGDVSKSQDYLNKLRLASGYLLKLIDNVLEMSRIESGKVEVHLKPVRIEQIEDDIRELCLELFSNKKQRVQYSNNMKVKVIEADAVRINEVCMNLLSNAYKYTPEGGTITIRLDQEEHDEEGYVWGCITISDTGVGMSKEFLPHLFEEFSREHTYTDSKIKGTGLGMAIVKKLVNLMGGSIHVESEIGKGTTIEVRLPHRVIEEGEIHSLSPEPGPSVFKGKRILLAEDNEMNAEIAMEVLRNLGIETHWAQDGATCVEMFRQAPEGTYDLILMDIQMPNMNGFEATSKIRSMEEAGKPSVPIIALTAKAFKEDKDNAALAGMTGHIAKPMDPVVLAKTLSEFLNI